MGRTTVMRTHDFFFLSTAGFLVGTISGGLGFSPVNALFALAVAVPIILILKVRLSTAGLIAVLFLVGNIYYAVDDYRYLSTRDSLASAVSFEGVVIDEPRQRIDAQTARVELDGARIFVRLETYPKLSYGDKISILGEIVPPPSDSYGDYMAKERVHGSVFYPKIEIIGNEANPFFKSLFSVRNYIKSATGRLFTQKEAAFLTGVMLGDRDEFSQEFLDKLSVSGTMHLTALSGLHMTILVFITLSIFSAVFVGRKRLSFAATFLVIALFVAMTGFKVSAVRASLMAFLVGFAGETGRMYSPRNAIALAALLITVWNPKAPVFDLGFQLSFAATISIIYFAPVLKRLPFFQTSGFLSWRDVLAITIAAQVGVAPLTIINFANFSLTALPANIAILVIMPALMILGFATVASSAILPPLAEFLSKPTAFLLDYAISIVETFSTLRIMFNPQIGIIVAILYYCVLIWICWRYSSILKRHERN